MKYPRDVAPVLVSILLASTFVMPAAAVTAQEAQSGGSAHRDATDPEAAGSAQRMAGPADIKPEVYRTKAFDNSARAATKRDEVIEEIVGLIPRVNGDKQGELLFRLAELYLEKSKFLYESAMAAYEQAYTAWTEQGRPGAPPELPEFLNQSEDYKEKSALTYEMVIERFPEFPRLDEVLYVAAYHADEVGNREKALMYFTQIIEEYKDSIYRADSFFALGEHYFSVNNLTEATRAFGDAYKLAEQSRRSGMATYALYMLAWCSYNAQSYDDAVRRFKEVIRLSMDDKEGGVRLAREAQHDLRIAERRRTAAYFEQAEYLWDVGEWRDAASRYHDVFMQDPQGEYARASAFNAVLAWEKAVKKEEAPVRAHGGILATPGCQLEIERDGRCAAKRKQGDVGQGIREAKLEHYEKGKIYEPMLMPEDLVKLAEACDAYAGAIPESDWRRDGKLEEELILVKFKAGYIYQSHNHFDEGAKRFGELIEKWPDSEYARRGADQVLDSYDARERFQDLEHWSRIFASNTSLMKDEKFAGVVRRFLEGAAFKNIDAVRQRVETAKVPDLALDTARRFEDFVREFPQSEFAPIALFNAQILYATHQRLDKAIERAEQLVLHYSEHLVANDNLKNLKLEETTYANLAAYHEQISDYKTAAEWSVKFAGKFRDDPRVADFVYNAAIFLHALGEAHAAVELFARYIREFPHRQDAPAVYLRMTATYEDNEDWMGAFALYRDFEKSYGSTASTEELLHARYKAALMLHRARREEEMLARCKHLLGGWRALGEKLRRSEVAAMAGGFCAFQTLSRDWAEYIAIKIEQKSGTSERQGLAMVAEALEAKRQVRDEVAKKYLDIKDYGSGEWAVAGLLRVAEVLFEYANTLREAPDPPALTDNPEALDIFRAELENVAFPVEEQGIQALEAALDAAFRLGLYSHTTIEIEDRLRKWSPAKFGRLYEMPFFVDQPRDSSASLNAIAFTQ